MQDNNNTTITRLSQLDMNGVYTYADYLMWQINERLELIKGKILKMAAPSSSHQSVALNITTQMHAFLRNSSCKVFVAPFDVRFPTGKVNKKGKEIYTVVQPDLCIICDTEKIDRLGCLGAPDMIVEVLSPSTMMKDITIKYSLYESEKVKEYWVVNPDLYSINTFVLNKKGKYEETGVHEWYKDAEMPAPIVPVHIFKGDLKIDFNTVFE